MPPVVRASERASHPITRLSSERSTWVWVWSSSCGNITLKLPRNGASYTIAFSYTGAFLERFETPRIDACPRTGAAAGRLWDKRWTDDPDADTRPPRSRYSADREFGPV